MFEDQLQAVQELLEADNQFKVLYERHQSLKIEIEDSGRTLDKFKLDKLKKEKLQIKDQLATRLQQHTG
jgi:uncharacterized protein YdcH (DUF465 family)